MPPLKGIDRGINGELLKALEESGHGRRIAVVDASYRIPRWAQTVDYGGPTTLQGLIGILRLTPFEDTIHVMEPDEGPGDHPDGPFCDVAVTALDGEFDYPDVSGIKRNDDATGEAVVPGFYSIANDESADTLFVRTRDEMAYACATFVVGHSQV